MSTEPTIRRCPVCDNVLKPTDTTYDQPICRREAEGLAGPSQHHFDPISAGWNPLGDGSYRRATFSS